MPLHEQAVNTLRSTLEAACSDPETGVPGAVAVVVDKSGDQVFSHAAGRRGVASSDKMTTDSIFWIASCTKLVAGIACMQLVEKGVLRLDDGEQIENLCPELKTLKVLRADGALEDKNKAITLRMLLTHTSGFAYSFFNPSLRNHTYPAGVDEFCGRLPDFIQPLVFQPGEGWEYGVSRDNPLHQLSRHQGAEYVGQIGIDWAGIALERVTGLRLNDYMRINIFEPLVINDISMFPSSSMMERLAYMNQRTPDGALLPRDHLMRVPLVETDEEQRSRCVHSGGGGLFAKPSEYCSKSKPVMKPGPGWLGYLCIDSCLFDDRNSGRPPQQRQITNHGGRNPQALNGRRDVHKPDPPVSRIQPARNPRRKARPDQRSARALPSSRRRTTRLGTNLYVD